MMKVSTLESSNAIHQTSEWTREGVRDKEHQSASHQNREQAQQQQIAIQSIDKLCGLVVGSKNT